MNWKDYDHLNSQEANALSLVERELGKIIFQLELKVLAMIAIAAVIFAIYKFIKVMI